MEPHSRIISHIVIPAIMPKSWDDLEFKAGSIKDAVKRVQIDIMDGIFTNSMSWPFTTASKGVILKDEDRAHMPDHVDDHFRKLQSEEKGLPFWEKIDYDVDLMVDNPAKAVMEWARVGVIRVILHVREENMNDIAVAITIAREFGLEISLALLPGEIPEKLKSFIFEKHLMDITGIQCMGIERVGYQHEPFSPKVFETIENIITELHSVNEKNRAEGQAEKDVEISVDGGVTPDVARPLYDAGVDKLVSGHDIFEAYSPAQEIQFFEDVLK